MSSEQFLMLSTNGSQHWSVAVYNYQTANLVKTYRNGGIVIPKTLQLLGEDYILSAEKSKPLLHVWQLNSQEVAKNLRLILPEPANCVAICPNNVYLAIGIGTSLYVWNVNGKLLSIQKKHYQPITCIVFSSDGQYVSVAGQDGMLLIYNLSDLISIHSSYLSQKTVGYVDPVYTFKDHSLPITDLFIGKFGKQSHLITVSTDQTCRIYNIITGSHLITIIFSEPLTCVIFDAPYCKLFIGGESGIIYLFNLEECPKVLTHHIDDKKIGKLIGHTKKVTCLDINITNDVLASGAEDNIVYLWEIKSQQILRKIDYTMPITNLKFVLSYANFAIDNFKPKIVLKTLERSMNTEDKYTCRITQTEDIELSDDENSLISEKKRTDLEIENMRLRTINKQLYSIGLQLSKKHLMK